METYRQRASYAVLRLNEETMKQINKIRHYVCDPYFADFCNKMLCKMIDDSGGKEKKYTDVRMCAYMASVRSYVCVHAAACMCACMYTFALKKR